MNAVNDPTICAQRSTFDKEFTFIIWLGVHTFVYIVKSSQLITYIQYKISIVSKLEPSGLYFFHPVTCMRIFWRDMPHYIRPKR